MEDILAQCLIANVRIILVGTTPMGIDNLHCNSLPYIMIGNRYVFLFEFAIGNLGTLYDTKIVAK